MTKDLMIALPKGRLGEALMARLEGTPLALDPGALRSRVLRIPTATPGLSALLLKGADLPRYVSAGIAALGVVGSDTLDELDADVLEVRDLGLGVCRLSLCAPGGVSLEDLARRPHLRLGTKFVRSTAAWLREQGLTAELVPLQSSVELAPVLGLADAIVDLVETGGTLRAHGLMELHTLKRTSARLIASRGSFPSEPRRMDALIRCLAEAAA